MRVSDKLKTNYNEYYQGESEWRRLGALDKANNIIALCDQRPHKTILEIGAGEGSILKRLSDLKFGEDLYALEISSAAVDVLRARNMAAVMECQLFDGYSIPYENGKFDLAILSHVVEHLEHPRQLLYEASRVASSVFIEVPLEDNFRLKRDFIFDTVGHINAYSPKTIRRLVQSCDLKVFSQITTNPSLKTYQYQYGRKAWLRYLPKELILRLTPGIATCLWTYHSALICGKFS
jgi:SAM-dependent methyltransferase